MIEMIETNHVSALLGFGGLGKLIFTSGENIKAN